jgi:predicted membrane protein
MSNNRFRNKPFISEVGIGFLLVGFSMLLNRLLPNLHFFFSYIFNFPMLIIVLSLFRGMNTKFKTTDWWIFLLVGCFLYFYKIIRLIPGINGDLFFPIIIIVIGIILIVTRNKKTAQSDASNNQFSDIPILPIEDAENIHYNHSNTQNESQRNAMNEEQDYLHIETVLGNNSRMVLSKQFKGGNCSSILGSVTIYLNKADLEGTVYINNFCLLGEIIIIVPSNFNVINQTTSVLGSVDDKRNFMNEQHHQKSIVLKGQTILGAITIKNF